MTTWLIPECEVICVMIHFQCHLFIRWTDKAVCPNIDYTYKYRFTYKLQSFWKESGHHQCWSECLVDTWWLIPLSPMLHSFKPYRSQKMEMFPITTLFFSHTVELIPPQYTGHHHLTFLWPLIGNLMPGDQILEVNGDSLVGVTSER